MFGIEASSAPVVYLLASVALYGAMIIMQAVAANLSGATSLQELLGSRDKLTQGGLSNFHGRTKRAQANMTESMVLFVPLILLALQLDDVSDNVGLGAAIFFFARLVYAPLYYLGVPVLRTLAWVAGMGGIVVIFVELMS